MRDAWERLLITSLFSRSHFQLAFRTVSAKRCLYKGTAPIFVTRKETDLRPLWQQAQAASAAGEASEVTMSLRRLRTYWFTQRVEKPLQLIPECATRFAQMILKHPGQSPLS
jgi:hypothetical protein